MSIEGDHLFDSEALLEHNIASLPSSAGRIRRYPSILNAFSVFANGVGVVRSWVDVTRVALPLVTFRWTYVFDSDGDTLTSDSTLRFRTGAEVERSLAAAGFSVADVRDAPDRPGRELVFVACRDGDGPVA